MKKIQSICLFLFAGTVMAQQDPQFSQYMYNMSLINPGYATDNLGVYNFGAIYRTQWVGVEGAPKTMSFFAHTPINEKLETGLNIVNDQIGGKSINQTLVTADLAYVARITNTAKLSVGLKAGAKIFNSDFSGYWLNDDISQDFAFNNNKAVFPNIGAGVFYFTDKYYLGVSLPNVMPSKHLKNTNGISAVGQEEKHIYATGGYVFNLTGDIKLKPSVMAKLVSNAPTAIDANLNALFFDKFEIGVSYRFSDAFVGLVNYRVMPNLRIGYAYDYTTSNLKQFSSGSHEIFVLFDLDILKGYDKSPRFF